jgi:hypothetical protein
MRALVLLAIILSACTSSEDLAQPKGPVFQLNTGRWISNAADLQPSSIGHAK